MARRMVEVVTDDLTGEELDGKVRGTEFTVDGTTYRLDLGPDSTRKFQDALAPFIGAADRVGKVSAAGSRKRASRTDLADIRRWANENGYTVSARGRVPSNVTEAYHAAH